jgi:hypothetical protein
MTYHRALQIRFQMALAGDVRQNTFCLILRHSPCRRGRLKRVRVPLMVFI